MTINQTIGRAVEIKTASCPCALSDLGYRDLIRCPLCETERHRLPDYENDLNAVTEAVKVLCDSDDLKRVYLQNLGVECETEMFLRRHVQLAFEHVNATAQQKAQALLPIAEKILKENE